MNPKTRKTSSVLGVLLAVGTTGLLQGQSPSLELFEQRIEFLKDSFQVPGMAVSVIRESEVVFMDEYGYSNLEHGIPMTDSSVFRVWSISKQFSTVSILKLWEEKRLRLEDPIKEYLDSIPDSWKEIKIRHLLTNTGGIPDYLNDYPEGRKLMGLEYEKVRDSTALLKFEPGMGWSYTNSGFWVLAKIVESVTGKPYQQYLADTFFSRSGMSRTRKTDFKAIIPGRVSGYRVVEGVPENSTRYLDEGYMGDGDGELMSSTGDLTRWILSLQKGEYISRQTLNLAWTPANLDSGDSYDVSYLIFYDDQASYGMGWFISSLRGEKVVWTPGAGRGFSTTILTVPSLEISIIVLCNTRRFLVADRIARDLAGWMMNELNEED